MRCGTNSCARRTAASLAMLASAAALACGTPRGDRPAAASAGAPAPEHASATVPHGDHNPHHGGIVLMKGDLHYEVVLDPTGRLHQVYFTDAVREDLPASMASSVTLTITRKNESSETIPLQIDDAGESWIGKGRAVSAPEHTMATIAFTIKDEPYSIDIPFQIPPAPATKPR